nr:methionine aminopeptidase 1D, chloroplastic/mitochondrial [Ipomoea batatas]
MAAASSFQPRLLSTFVGDTSFFYSANSLHRLFSCNPGSKHASMQMSRTFSGLTNLLFNRRNIDAIANGKRARLKPGKVSPCRPVPDHILRPPYVNSRKPPGISSGPEVHDKKGIERMRASGRLAAQVLQYAGTLVKPGITTDEIDQAVHQMIIDNGAYPSPLGYGGFPKSVCTSVNECICHGIPDSRPLEDGDIINIDVTVYLNGYHGDTSATFFVGDVDEEARNLVQINIIMALYNNLLAMVWDVSFIVIQSFYITETMVEGAWFSIRHSLSVIFLFPYFSSLTWLSPDDDADLCLTLTLTLLTEPMLTVGSIQPIMWDDDWTVVTEDGSLSAQFEHTILITQDGAEILTQC